MNALANGKKVIINTPFIKEEIFYSKNNILIINDKGAGLDFSFLEAPFEYFDFSDLFIEEWILILFGLKDNKYNIKLS